MDEKRVSELKKEYRTVKCNFELIFGILLNVMGVAILFGIPWFSLTCPTGNCLAIKVKTSLIQLFISFGILFFLVFLSRKYDISERFFCRPKKYLWHQVEKILFRQKGWTEKEQRIVREGVRKK